MFHARNFHAGIMAESAVALKYAACGFAILEERYRSSAGEIDLIAEYEDNLYFIEVKKSKTHDQAALRIQPRQVGRVRAAAQLYLMKTNRPVETNMRFDAALVDQHGVIKVLPNAF